jgi:hypothetical protein
MSEVRVGMIGYNDGNGHPFSFSAIINGYNEEASASCPYPNINAYLKARRPEEFGVGNFRITHVWAPGRVMSKNIAAYARITNVVDDYLDMVGNVDAIIIARDDAETHREIARPFLEAGLKLFIDKPLCATGSDLRFFAPYLESGQVMSCSGLRFFPKVEALAKSNSSILFAHCVAPLDWFKYGIHVLEGVIPLFPEKINTVTNIGANNNDIVKIEFEGGKSLIIQVESKTSGGLRATIFTSDSDPHFIHFNDNFTCFKNQLLAFWDFVSLNKISIEPRQTIELMKALIAGSKSKEKKSVIHIADENKYL